MEKDSIAIPQPLTFKVENGSGEAVFGPELADYIRNTTDSSFPILDK